MLKHLLIGLIIGYLTGCSLLPEQGPAPKQLQLQPLSSSTQTQPASSNQSVNLILERPLAPAALMSRSLWYQAQAYELMPFRDHLWTQPLPDQLQQRLEAYLVDQQNGWSIQRDQPGNASGFRLRIHLYDWYLDVERQSLYVNLQVFLLDNQGQVRRQWRWQEEEPLLDNSAPELVNAGQKWLQRWAQALAENLETFLRHETDPN